MEWMELIRAHNKSRWIECAMLAGLKSTKGIHGHYTFVVEFDQKKNALFAISSTNIFEYQFDKDSWINVSTQRSLLQEYARHGYSKQKTAFKIKSTPDCYTDLSARATAMNCDKQKIYINYKKKHIAILSLKNKNFRKGY